MDPTLKGAVDTTRIGCARRSRACTARSSRRASGRTRRSGGSSSGRRARVSGGSPQERTLSVPFFVNRYGLALCDRLLETLPLDTDKHYVLTL